MDPAAYKFPPEPRNDLTVDEFWIRNVPAKGSPYWAIVCKAAALLQSDCCTCAPDICMDACYEHDIHWRTGRTVFGVPITTAQSNRRLRKVMQSRSPLGGKSFFAQWYWYGVTIGAKFLKHKST